MDGEALKAATSALTERLAASDEILVAFFHGSAAEGEPFRDLDIAVVVDREGIPRRDDVRYSVRLAVQLSRVTGLPVDVRVVNDAPPAFRDRASRGRILVSRSPADAVRFMERAWDDWFDFRPIARAYLRDMAR